MAGGHGQRDHAAGAETQHGGRCGVQRAQQVGGVVGVLRHGVAGPAVARARPGAAAVVPDHPVAVGGERLGLRGEQVGVLGAAVHDQQWWAAARGPISQCRRCVTGGGEDPVQARRGHRCPANSAGKVGAGSAPTWTSTLSSSRTPQCSASRSPSAR